MTNKPLIWSGKTLSAQALGLTDEPTGALVLPTYSATTYLRDADNQYRTGNVYSRDDNPTYKPVETLLCKLEKGHEALLFSSGMAAAVAVFQALKPGDHVIAPKVMYWSLRNWLLGLGEVELVDCSESEAVPNPPGANSVGVAGNPGQPHVDPQRYRKYRKSL